MSPCPHHPPRAHAGTPGPCRLGQRLHPLQCLREEEEAQAPHPSPPCQPRSRTIRLFFSSSPCFTPFWSQVHFLLCAKTKGIPPGERQPALAPRLGHRSLGQGLGHWSQPGDTGSLPQGPGMAGSHAGSGQGGTQRSPPQLEVVVGWARLDEAHPGLAVSSAGPQGQSTGAGGQHGDPKAPRGPQVLLPHPTPPGCQGQDPASPIPAPSSDPPPGHLKELRVPPKTPLSPPVPSHRASPEPSWCLPGALGCKHPVGSDPPPARCHPPCLPARRRWGSSTHGCRRKLSLSSPPPTQRWSPPRRGAQDPSPDPEEQPEGSGDG